MAGLNGYAILLAVLAPFVASLGTIVTKERLAEAWTYAAAIVAALSVMVLAPAVFAGDHPAIVLFEMMPGLEIAFGVDVFGLTFGALASSLWVVTSVYSSGYVRATELQHRRRYFACFAASIGAANTIAFADNMLTLLVGLELLTIVTYPLVAHDESEAAISAGRRYLVYALSGGLALTLAAAWSWKTAGTLRFMPGGFLGEGGGKLWLFVLYFAGAGVKAAVMPLHGWLPAAMVAPTPVSALLHAVAVVKAGVFTLMRILGFVFGGEALAELGMSTALPAICGFTVLAASFIALREDNLKRRLAYSTISSLSIMVLAMALTSARGAGGALLYFVNHSLAKITLFFCAGAIHSSTGKHRVSELGGVGRAMPWTMGAFTVASLSLVGVPGLGTFVAKLTILRGALDAHQLWIVVVMLGGAILSAAYLLPIVRAAFFETAKTGDRIARETGALMRGPIVVAAAAVVALGLLPVVLDAEARVAALAAQGVIGAAE